jgi:hypothetical protein
MSARGPCTQFCTQFSALPAISELARDLRHTKGGLDVLQFSSGVLHDPVGLRRNDEAGSQILSSLPDARLEALDS